MALRRIITNEDPVLRKTSREVTKFDARLGGILDDMADTMYHANVGILRRAVVIDTSDDGSGLIELINPEIVAQSGEQTGQEGCLSVPGIYGIVRRPMKVTVRAQDRSGKSFELSGEGLLARAMCHEIAHLDGGLFTDVMDRLVEQEEQE